MNRPTDQLPFERGELESTLVARFEKVARALPDHPALCDRHRRFTYASLWQRCEELAAAIMARSPASSPTAYLVNHSANMVIGALASLMAGTPYVCIHPGLPLEAQRDVLADARPTLLLTDNAHLATAIALAGDRCEVLSIDSIGHGTDTPAPHRPICAADPAVIFYTSGSTGRPKGVVKSHRAVLHRAWLSAQYDGIRPGDVQSLLTFCSFASSEADLFGALLNGACLDLFNVADRGLTGFAEWIRSHGVTVLHPPVVLLRRFLSTLEAPGLLPSVRLVALAGETVLSSDIEQWRRLFSSHCELRHRFSSTEAGHIAVACMRADSAGAINRAMPVTDKNLSIVDAAGRPVPAGTAGELLVRSPYLSDGYWQRGDETNRVFSLSTDHPAERIFHTGDQGRLLADGSFEFLGRLDNQVKIRGYRVELREIETALAGQPGVKEAAVIVKQRGDEVALEAFVVLAESELTAPTLLREGLQIQLPSWKVPTQFHLVASLPLTLTGKIDRRALDSLAAEKSTSSIAPPVDAQSAADEVTLILRSIWEQLFSRKGIAEDDNFFDLGGYSLLAAQLMHHIQLRFERTLPLSQLFATPTLGALAAVLNNDIAASLSTSPDALLIQLKEGERDRIPLICVAPPGGSAMSYVPLSRRLERGQPVYALEWPPDTGNTSLEMVALELAERVRTFTSGPISLCGHSYGGVLAFEIAQQLIMNGGQVHRLILLDARVPQRRAALSWPNRLRKHLALLFERGPQARLQHATHRLRERIRQAGTKTEPSAFHPGELANMSNTGRAQIRLARAYRPKRYDGTLTLLKAEQPEAWTEFLQPEPFNAWDAFARQIDVHLVPGNHMTMMQEPHLTALADTLHLCLRPVESTSN